MDSGTKSYRYLIRESISGGEKTKLFLAGVFTHQPPHNLDLLSLDTLTSTMKNYRGTLLVISHDKRSVEAIGITKAVELKIHKN